MASKKRVVVMAGVGVGLAIKWRDQLVGLVQRAKPGARSDDASTGEDWGNPPPAVTSPTDSPEGAVGAMRPEGEEKTSPARERQPASSDGPGKPPAETT